jgi:hypothetical protein
MPMVVIRIDSRGYVERLDDVLRAIEVGLRRLRVREDGTWACDPSTPRQRLAAADPLQFPFDLHENLKRVLDVSLLQDVVPADAL